MVASALFQECLQDSPKFRYLPRCFDKRTKQSYFYLFYVNKSYSLYFIFLCLVCLDIYRSQLAQEESQIEILEHKLEKVTIVLISILNSNLILFTTFGFLLGSQSLWSYVGQWENIYDPTNNIYK